MFPKNSQLWDAVRGCEGDGYCALKLIINCSHPVYYNQPSTLVKTYPRQRDQSLIQYYQAFVDWQQLRAFISDIDKTLDDPSEIDIFLDNVKYSTYLNRVLCDKRRIAAYKHKFTKKQIVDTITVALLNSDSPALAKNQSKSSSDKSSSVKKTFSPYKTTSKPKRVNALAIVSDSDESKSDEELLSEENTDSGTVTHVNINAISTSPVAMQVNAIKVPDSSQARDLHTKYKRVINAIQLNKTTAYQQKCLVCQKKHLFEDCDVLKKVDFLRYCIQLRKEEAARAKAFPNEQGPIPNGLNFIDKSSSDSDYDSDSNSSEDQDSETSDFHQGQN
mmetsp:Transcript_6983/g.10601  ORF Transcript_6983/g.10601 Transcript_6983/m.10601 type:complete len:332 (+) Transcript_6983:601-1596(+)|eukprot:CAMPEP_0178915498 /NCGR_PEP_ID=MMETSP0786-20121207/12058_1 /TAXON_ID=186022 /ORGANISM="Thalassionema frauenfeldii, Strain CCMP 1798" /LENGTH=331 /DNA_ID=CAMNT_0020588611 /DNA_START=559 /DNA_END=1554 /DNA_ORIENTATION=+